MDTVLRSCARLRWPLRLAAGLMVGVVITLIAVNALNGVPRACDFTTFYASARAYLKDLPLLQPYTYLPFFGDIVISPIRAPLDVAHMSDNLNPPVVTFLTLPLAFVSLKTAFYIWSYVQFFLALGLWIALIPPRQGLRAGGVVLFCAYFPVLANMMVGQIGLFLFAALAAFLLSLKHQKLALAGIFLGVALCLKLFVGLVFIALLFNRAWRVLFYGSGTWLLLNLLALDIFGLQNHLDWLALLHQNAPRLFNWNLSLEMFLSRYISNAPLHMALLCAAWGLGLVALYHLRTDRAILLALTLPLMLLLAPLSWLYYAPVLLLWLALNLEALGQITTRRYNRLFGSVMCAALGMSAIPQFLKLVGAPSLDLFPLHLSDAALTTVNNTPTVIAATQFRWLVLPELYTAALVLAVIVPLLITRAQKQTCDERATGF